MIHVVPYIPNEILHIILEYDGRIKYKNGQYVNIIHKQDERYNIVTPILDKKMKIMETMKLSSHYGWGCLFVVWFNSSKTVGLLYDYNFSYRNKYEICYYDWRNDNINQMRTFL